MKLENTITASLNRLIELEDAYFRELDSTIEERLKGVTSVTQACTACEEIEDSTEFGDSKAEVIAKMAAAICPAETEAERKAYIHGYYSAFTSCRQQHIRSMMLYHLFLSNSAAAKDRNWPDTIDG